MKQEAAKPTSAVTSAKSFFDKFYAANKVSPSNAANTANDNFIKRSSNKNEQLMTLRKIQHNTDTIIDLLKRQNENKNDKKSLLDMLPLLASALGPVLAGLIPGIIAASNPEKYKVAESILKNGPKTAALAAEAAAKAAKAADTASIAAKSAGAIGSAAKVMGKFSDNKYVKGVSRMTSGGLAAGRAIQGDYAGAGAEVVSLGLSEAARKAKSPRAKIALTGASIATDAGLIIRDYFRGSDSSNDTSSSVGTAVAGSAALAAGAMAIRRSSFATPVSAGQLVASPAATAGGSLGNVGKTAGAIAKGGMKFGGKLLPGAGLALGTYGAYSRASSGDYVGAIAEGVSGIVSLLPGLGTAAAAVIQGGLLVRDMTSTAATESSKQIEKSTTLVKQNTAAISDQVSTVNKSIAKNASETSLVVKESNNSMISFTKSLGSSLLDWLSRSTMFFTGAFAALASTSGNILNALKESSFGQGISNFFGGGSGGVSNSAAILKKLKSGDLKGMATGSVSEAFESGGRGVGTISSGVGDHGGVSYGKHQFSTKTMGLFLATSRGKKYASHFAGHAVGSAGFNAKYSELAAKDGKGLEEAQRQYTYDNYVIPANNAIKKKTGMDVMAGRGRALKELLFSTSVQYGVGNAVTMFTHPGIVGKDPNRISDSGLIKAIQDYKGKAVNRHFKSSSASVKQGVANRIATEKDVLLQIDSKVGGFNGAQQSVHGNAATNSIKNQASGMLGKGVGIGVLKPGAALDPSSHSKSAPGVGVLKPEAYAKQNTKTSTSKSDNIKNNGSTFNLDTIVSSAYNAAKGRKSKGQCAEYVRKAIESGYKKVGGLGHANEYHKSLPKIGWKSVGNNTSSWAKGDISVFSSTGSAAGKKYGHVAIWSGAVWISDFIQPDVQPNKSLGVFPFTVYRAIHGTSSSGPVGSPSDATGVADGGTLDASVGGSDSVGGDATGDIMSQSIDAAVAGVASLASAFGNMEIVKDAIGFVNNAKVDEWKARKVDKVDMTGFSKVPTTNQEAYAFKYGNGGGVNEDELFNPNLDRQYKTDVDILGNAGYIPGVVRQEKSNVDILGNAGRIPGIVRQGRSGSKWYNKLFGGSNSDLYGSLAGMFGLGDLYSIGQELSQASTSGNLGTYTLNKTVDLGNKAILKANTKDRDMVDGYISSMNNQHSTMKMNMITGQGSSLPEIPQTLPATGHMKGNGNIDGMSAALVTRNPDTIFRAVCINMMKTSTT